MTDKDTAEIIQRCIEEISALRHQVAALQPRADAFEAIFKILTLIPGRSQGMGEDIVWRLRNELAELQPKPEAVAAAAEA